MGDEILLNAFSALAQEESQSISMNLHTPLCKITSTGEIEQRFRLN